MTHSIFKIKERANTLAQQARDAAGVLAAEHAGLAAAQATQAAAEAALALTQGVAAAVQQRAHQRIAGVVSRCLTMVFEEPYEFRIEFTSKRNKTEAKLTFVRDGLVLEDPADEAGGGVVDVAAFALRLAAIMFSRPKLRRVVIMDEPFRFVSRGYRARLANMLETLATELDMQFIIVTHMPELQAGTIVELE